MSHNLPILRQATEILSDQQSLSEEDEEQPVLTKLDSTRDLRGALFVPGNWRSKHKELCALLGKWMDTTFKDNGNSFNSCLQFVGKASEGSLLINVKYYWKTLALFQSETAAKAIGMNTRGLFCPHVRMSRVLKETSNETLSRIEISYIAPTLEAQAEFFDDEFPDRAFIDLGNAQQALNEVNGIGWHIPMHEFLEVFQSKARPQQLLLVQPTIAAMIYAENSKTNCFTGSWKVKTPGRAFDYLDFLSRQQLPGPGSVTTCIIQPRGPKGATHFLTIHKKTSLSEVPGLQFKHDALGTLQRPSSWEDHALSNSVKQSIVMEVIEKREHDPMIPLSVN